VFLTTLVNFG